MSGTWRGLTWDHPRGYRALEAAARSAEESGLTLSWDRQPLEGFIPDHDGQPARRSAWCDPAVNAHWGGFYASTLNTLEQAVLRPRHDGAVAFQTAAAERLRQGLFDEYPADAVLDDLQTLHDRDHAPGAEI